MVTDTRWIVATGATVILAVFGSAVAVIAVTVNLIGDVRADLRGMDNRLRAVEIAVAKVDQRLAALERSQQPAPPGD